jgi:hypothetical protein
MFPKRNELASPAWAEERVEPGKADKVTRGE